MPPDPVEDLAQAPGEAGGRRLPLADAGPPAPAVVVPAGVDAEHLRPDRRRRVHERQQAFRGGVALEGVHVVVEDHRLGRVVRVRPPAGTPVRRQPGHGADEVVGEGDRDGDRGERLARPQHLQPRVVDVGRAGQREVAVGGVLADLVAPAAVVLDLPPPGGGAGGVGRDPDREVAPGRPGSGRDDGEHPARVLSREALLQVREERVVARLREPAPLAQPLPDGPVQRPATRPVPVGRPRRHAEVARERGHRAERDGRGPVVRQPDPAAQRGDAVRPEQDDLGPQPRHRVDHADDQLEAARHHVLAVPGVAGPPPEGALHEPVARQRVPVTDGDDLQQRPARRHRQLERTRPYGGQPRSRVLRPRQPDRQRVVAPRQLLVQCHVDSLV